MSLEQRINEDMKAAMKSGDKTKLDTIRLLRAAIIEFNKSGTGAMMSDDDEQTILNRFRSSFYSTERAQIELLNLDLFVSLFLSNLVLNETYTIVFFSSS